MSTQNVPLTADQAAKLAEGKAAIDRFLKVGIRPTVKAALVLSVVEDAVKEASKTTSLGGCPSGHLYAAVSGLLTLDEYQSIIDVLKAEKKVRVAYHLVSWIGR